MGDRLVALHEFARSRDLRVVEQIGAGLEFTVFRALTAAGDQLVLRLPHGDRYQSNANDPDIDTRALLTWEHDVTGWLAARGIPVAVPLELAHTPGDALPDVLVSSHVPDDGDAVDGVQLGGLLAALHRLRPTTPRPPAARGRPAAEVVRNRLRRRWATAAALSPDVPQPAPDPMLTIADRPPGSLLHLDVRRPNLRCRDGAVLALLDWSNALIGDTLLELGRVTEFARLPDNGLDLDAIRRGYRRAATGRPATGPCSCTSSTPR
jgi:aminoglycoside phosphotransferase (APT) family kinase protein